MPPPAYPVPRLDSSSLEDIVLCKDGELPTFAFQFYDISLVKLMITYDTLLSGSHQ